MNGTYVQAFCAKCRKYYWSRPFIIYDKERGQVTKVKCRVCEFEQLVKVDPDSVVVVEPHPGGVG